MRILALGILGLMLTACSMTKGYEGPSRGADEVARVHAHGVTFKSVNGIDVGSVSSGLEIPPGETEIRLLVNASNFNARGIDHSDYLLRMVAEAGREYSVTGKRGHRRLCAFPLNENTGQPEFDRPAGCIVSTR